MFTKNLIGNTLPLFYHFEKLKLKSPLVTLRKLFYTKSSSTLNNITNYSSSPLLSQDYRHQELDNISPKDITSNINIINNYRQSDIPATVSKLRSRHSRPIMTPHFCYHDKENTEPTLPHVRLVKKRKQKQETASRSSHKHLKLLDSDEEGQNSGVPPLSPISQVSKSPRQEDNNPMVESGPPSPHQATSPQGADIFSSYIRSPSSQSPSVITQSPSHQEIKSPSPQPQSPSPGKSDIYSTETGLQSRQDNPIYHRSINLTDINSTVEPPKLKVTKLSQKARVPVRGSSQAAGYDLYSAADIKIPAKGQVLVPTGLSMAVPKGTYGRVAPRSGLAVKHSIDCGAGVIDADYRGEVLVLLFNFGQEDYEVKEGDRIAQLILEHISTPDVVEVDSLEDTVRGASGFGSTGFR